MHQVVDTNVGGGPFSFMLSVVDDNIGGRALCFKW